MTAAAIDAARGGFWAFVAFRRGLLGQPWTRASGRRALGQAAHPERWDDIRPALPEIRRLILEYEFANKPTLKSKLEAIRAATHVAAGGWGFEPVVWCSALLLVGSDADPQTEMWAELRTWPEYAAASRSESAMQRRGVDAAEREARVLATLSPQDAARQRLRAVGRPHV